MMESSSESDGSESSRSRTPSPLPNIHSNPDDMEEQHDDENEDQAEEMFDINLPAEHSYLSNDLVELAGRSVLDAGWVGMIPCWGHHSIVFPGETVPMMCRHPTDIIKFKQVLQSDKLFGLLCPDETGLSASGFGVICEIFEATSNENTQEPLSFKARARQRFKFCDMPKTPKHLNMFLHVINLKVRILPEVVMGDPMFHQRLFSLDKLRHKGNKSLDSKLRKMDAACTSWPLFVYDIFDVERATLIIRQYFRKMSLESLPTEVVSLSFWVGSNLALSVRDRLALFVVDNAILRLHMELEHIKRKCVLCCGACMSEITKKDHILAMSKEGLHSNYCNLGGYVHDIITVSKVDNVAYTGRPSLEFSWFPGYSWTIAVCRSCATHIGWRFKAVKKHLRPQVFWALCRNYVSPIDEDNLTDENTM